MGVLPRHAARAVAIVSIAALFAFAGTPALAETSGINAADTAWMIAATALVLMMTIPGLALFYAGMVRKKNVLATMAQSLATVALISILWVAFGYSLAFVGDGPSLLACFYPLRHGKWLVKACGRAVDNLVRGRTASTATAPNTVRRLDFRRMGGDLAPGYVWFRAAGWPRLVTRGGELQLCLLGKRAPRRPSGEARLPVTFSGARLPLSRDAKPGVDRPTMRIGRPLVGRETRPVRAP